MLGAHRPNELKTGVLSIPMASPRPLNPPTIPKRPRQNSPPTARRQAVHRGGWRSTTEVMGAPGQVPLDQRGAAAGRRKLNRTGHLLFTEPWLADAPDVQRPPLAGTGR